MDEVHYLLGNTCNLNCDFCFWERKEAPATFESVKHIINEINKSGARKITFSGGEPTCAPTLLKALEYANKKGLETILHTNGLLIDEKFARKIAPFVSRISLSVDGSNEKVTIKMRKEPSVGHTIFLINLFHSIGVPVNVKTLITKVNREDIKNIGELLQTKPIQYWSLLEFNPIGRGLINKTKYFLSHKDFTSIAKKIVSRFPSIRIKIREFKSKPEKYCFITANGKVYAYIPSLGDTEIGDLSKNTLSSIINFIRSH